MLSWQCKRLVCTGFHTRRVRRSKQKDLSGNSSYLILGSENRHAELLTVQFTCTRGYYESLCCALNNRKCVCFLGPRNRFPTDFLLDKISWAEEEPPHRDRGCSVTTSCCQLRACLVTEKSALCGILCAVLYLRSDTNTFKNSSINSV